MSLIPFLTPFKTLGGLQFANEVTEFNPSPRIGESCVKDDMLYVYLDYAGTATWYPMVKMDSIYIHEQTTAASQWVVDHNMGSTDFVYSVFSNNVMVEMEITATTENRIVLNPGYPVSGRAIFMFGVVAGGQVSDTPYIDNAVVSAGSELILSLSNGDVINVGAIPAGGSSASWRQQDLVNVLANSDNIIAFTVPDQSLNRDVAAWRLEVDTNTNRNDVVTTFGSNELSNFTVSPGVVFDLSLMSLSDMKTNPVPTFERAVATGGVASIDVDFTSFDTMKSIKFKVS